MEHRLPPMSAHGGPTIAGRRGTLPGVERPGRPLLVLGFVSAVAQSVLLREAMALLGGSELAWGAVLATWLVGMAAGAALAVGRGRPEWGGSAPLLVIVAAGAGVLLLRAGPSLWNVSGGESLATLAVPWLWFGAVVPAAVTGGAGFTLLAARYRTVGGAGRAYAAEALGGLVGGTVFTFVLAPWGTAAVITLTTGLAVAALLAPRRLVAAVVALGAAAVAAAPAGDTLASLTWTWSRRPGALGAWTETRSQRLEMAEGWPRALYADGRLLATWPDPWSTVPRAHLLMLLHTSPRRVLLVGGFADGTVDTVARHVLAMPGGRLDVVPTDPEMVEVLPRWYGETFLKGIAGPGIALHRTDPVRVVQHGGPWDEILLMDPDPSTLRANRTRTLEFFERCRESLAPGGVLVVRVGVPDTYLGGAAGRLVAVLASNLRRVFPRLGGVPGENLFLVASGGDVVPVPPVETLAARWEARGLEDQAFRPEMIPLLLDPSRQKDLDRFVAEARAPPSTFAHPRAVPLAVAVAEGRGRAGLVRVVLGMESRNPAPLLVFPLALLGVAALRRLSGGVPALETAVVVGASSMTWWLVLVGTWQAVSGSVYTEVGALSATFMGGLWVGAAVVGRRRAPERTLAALLACGGLLSLGMAVALVSWPPRGVIVLLLLVGGGLTGAAFPGIARLAGGDSPRLGGGRGFAADETGAALAALVVGLVAIPWAGFVNTVGTVAALDLALAALLIPRWSASR